MRIQDLRIAGFKSFVDPVAVRIEAGLTGVVGPNGCGKSNLLEAIRWAMGASSARALRGGEMDDVIFAGTDVRPARDVAEVTIVLDNSDHTAPPMFNDAEIIEVVRRIKRASGSTFKVNGRETRARDVQLLFADASTGANSPSLVRQGQISELIAAKPENRRRILEEAAGIAGLHARRHEAEGKLKQAEANLEKLDEILRHMESQLEHLRKQARQAERYRALAGEIRGLEAFVLATRMRDAIAAAEAAENDARAADNDIGHLTIASGQAARAAEASEGAINPAREEQAIAEAVLRRLDAKRYEIDRELTAAREALANAEADIRRIAADTEREEALQRDATEALVRLSQELEQLPPDTGQNVALAAANLAAHEADEARSRAETALAEAAGQAAAAEAERRALAQAADEAKGRAARLSDALARAKAECDRLGAAAPNPVALENARAVLDAARASAETAANDADTAESAAEQASAADVAARDLANAASSALSRLTAEIQGLEAVTRRANTASGNYPRVLDRISVEPGYEKALAAALGDDLSAATDTRAAAFWAGAETTAPQWPKGVEALATKIKAPQQLAARIAHIGVTTRSEGGALAPSLPIGARLVSRDGDLWRWDGFVRRADAALPAAALLEQRNRLEALNTQLEAVKQQAASASSEAAQKRASADQARAKARNARALVPQTMNTVAKARETMVSAEAAAERARATIATAEAARQRAAADNAEAASRAEAAISAVANAPLPEDQDTIRARQATALQARARAAHAQAEATRLAREGEALKARRGALTTEQAMWTRRQKEALARLKQLEGEGFAAANRREGARAAPQGVAERRQLLLDEAPKAEARKRAADDALALAETGLRAARDRARDADAALATAREHRAATYAKRDVALARATDLADEARRALDIEPDELEARARAALGDSVDKLGLDDAERRVERLKREREGMGGVNLGAAEETVEQESRLQALSSEGTDLTNAITKLRAGVTEINEEGRERLLAAFDIVNGHFKALFETLFEGGSAELRLSLGDDPLAGGLEIYACPPGKRLQAMSLLSGGEQALTAASLIFAVFLSNPSPICVLDEVDAPLDDSNVDRFCRLLDEMRKRTNTRFLVITHHPVTMARMDRLYGVTMVERGVSQLVSVDLQKAEELVAA